MILPTAASAATGTIEGTVIDAVSKDPVANIEVCAYTAKSSASGGCALTDPSGNYTIDSVQPGIYLVEFWAIPSLNYLRQFYDGAAREEEAEFVFVNGSETVTGIDAELQPGAKLSGIVKDAQSHAPVGGVEICAYEVTIELSRCTSSSSSGTYTLAGLPNGLYGVEFSAWEGSVEYLRQYYDHKSYWQEANLLSLSTGQSLAGVDADLQRAASITGTITNSEGAPARWAIVCAQTLFGAYANCEEANSSGRYVLGRLAPGAYKVVFGPEEAGEGQYLTRYYNEKSTFSLADQVLLSEGATAPNINARLEKTGKKGVAVTTVPAGSGKKSSSMPKKPHKCKKGYRRKLIHGKRRCARIVKPRRHHRGDPSAA
jgi:hypothetical protein